MWNPLKKKKLPTKVVKLIYDAYVRGNEAGLNNCSAKSFDEFKEQLQKDFDEQQAKKKG